MKINIEYIFDITKGECTASTILDGDKLVAVGDEWPEARMELLRTVRTYMRKPQDEKEVDIETEFKSEPEVEPEPDDPEPENFKPTEKVEKKNAGR